MSQTMSPPKSALPPGPRVPAWWQLVRFAGDPLGLLDECHRRYGDAFTLHVAGNGRFVMLSDPEAVREVFRGDLDVLHSGGLMNLGHAPTRFSTRVVSLARADGASPRCPYWHSLPPVLQEPTRTQERTHSRRRTERHPLTTGNLLGLFEQLISFFDQVCESRRLI